MDEKLLLIESETYRIYDLCRVFEKAVSFDIEDKGIDNGYAVLLEEIQISLKKICLLF